MTYQHKFIDHVAFFLDMLCITVYCGSVFLNPFDADVCKRLPVAVLSHVFVVTDIS